MNFIKKNWTYFICVVMGVLNFILFAIPYVAEFAKIYGITTFAEGVSGYRVMDMWNLGFGGVMSSMMQIFIFLCGVALLVFGIMGLLKAKGSCKAFPDTMGKYKSKKLAQYGLIAMTVLNVLLLIFLIIVTAEYTAKSSYYYKAGIKLSAGIFLSIIFFASASVVAILFDEKLGNKAIEEDEGKEPLQNTEEKVDKAVLEADAGKELLQNTEEKVDKAVLEEENNNKKLARFLLTFLLGWIGSVAINRSVLKPRGYVSRSWAYFWLGMLTFGLYKTIASIFNWAFDPRNAKNIGYKRK